MRGTKSTVRGWQRRKWIFSLFTRSSVGGSLTFHVALVAGEAGGLFSASLEFQFRDRRTWSRDIASAKSTSNQSWGIICTKKNVISSQNTLNRGRTICMNTNKWACMQLAVKGCRVSGICPKDVLLYKKYDRYQEIEKLQFILQNETFKYHTRDCLPR